MQRQEAVRVKSAEKKERDPETLLCAGRHDSFFFRCVPRCGHIRFIMRALRFSRARRFASRGASAAPVRKRSRFVRRAEFLDPLNSAVRRDFARLNAIDASSRKEFYVVRGTRNATCFLFPLSN